MSSSATAYAPKLFGERLANRYLVGEVIGGGGFAWVYRGSDTLLERDVALKVLKPREGGTYPKELQARFIQEAKMTARLTSPYTVTLYDYGTHTCQDGSEFLYMACEFVDGVTLSDHIRARGTLKPLECAEVIQQALQSLQEAHRSGFVHRDIKSANIMLYTDASGRQSVKVLDYGIGKALTPEWDAKLTQTGSLTGTPAYASPEQLRSEPVLPATDLYSLGVVGFEMLTGAHPYQGRSTTNVLVEVVMGPDILLPPPLDQGPLASIIHKMLKKSQEERYERCGQVLEDLKWLETQEDRQARDPSLDAPTRPAIDTQSIELLPPSPTHIPRAAIAAFALLILTLLAGIVWVWSSPSPAEVATVPPPDDPGLLEAQNSPQPAPVIPPAERDSDPANVRLEANQPAASEFLDAPKPEPVPVLAEKDPVATPKPQAQDEPPPRERRKKDPSSPPESPKKPVPALTTPPAPTLAPTTVVSPPKAPKAPAKKGSGPIDPTDPSIFGID